MTAFQLWVYLVIATLTVPLLNAQRRVCPVISPEEAPGECAVDETNLCEADDQCEGGQRCCTDGCFLQCTTPVKPTGCPVPIDLGLIVDSSGSISRTNWGKTKEFLKSIANAFEISEKGTHVSAMVYATNAQMAIKFNQFKGAHQNSLNIAKAMDDLKHLKGLTFIDRALRLAHSDMFTEASGMRKGVRKVALVITDGQQTTDEGEYELLNVASQPLKDAGVDVYALGVGLNINILELLQIASSENTVFQVNSFGQLGGVVKNITSGQCKACSNAIDVMYGVPTSTSMSSREFSDMKDFIKGSLGFLEVGSRKAHVSFVPYSDTAEQTLELDKFYSKEKLEEFVDKDIQQSGRSFNVEDALNRAADNGFTIFGGTRPGVPKVMILLAPQSTSSADAVRRAAVKLKSTGAKLITVGIGNDVNQDLMKSISSQPQRKYNYKATDMVDLNTYTNDIIETACKSRYPKCPRLESVQPDCANEEEDECSVDGDCEAGQSCCQGPDSCKRTCGGNKRNCLITMDVGIVMDSSEIVSSRDFAAMKDFAKSIVYELADTENDIKIGLMQYGENAQTIRDFNGIQSAAQLVEAIDGMQKGVDRQRRVDRALRAARRDLFSLKGGMRQGHPRQLIMVTGGASTPGSESIEVAAKELDDLGVNRFAVGISNDVNVRFLTSLASDNRFVLKANRPELLKGQASTLQQLMCQAKPGVCKPPTAIVDPLACQQFFPSDQIPCGKGKNDKAGSVEFPLTKEDDYLCPGESKCCKTNDGCFLACQYPPRACEGKLDLTLVLDSSESAGSVGFQKVKRFAKEFIDGFDVNRDGAHVALITFGSSPGVEFRLNTFTDKQRIKDRIDALTFRGGRGRLAAALNAAANDVYTTASGMRDQTVNKSLVIIHDGRFDDGEAAIRASTALKTKFVDVFDVAVGDNPDVDTIKRVVSREPYENTFMTSSYNALDPNMRRLTERVCEGALKLVEVVGPPGPPGAKGSPGDAGPRGNRGLPGPPGPAGGPGEKGYPGFRGSIGRAGPAGRPGEIGPLKSVPGAKGPLIMPEISGGGVPPVGLPGVRGRPGPRGPDGLHGYPGSRGPSGDRGSPGPPGPMGQRGQPGRNGADGEQGPPGRQGPLGDPGNKGPVGDSGTPGLNGPKGDPGWRGIKGSKGPRGETGDDGLQGKQGPLGKDGKPGAPGSPGQPGRTGATGQPGPGGPTGPAGNPGPQGAPGANGSPGAPGSSGAKGSPGNQGSPGNNGYTGEPGNIGKPGLKGVAGENGRMGETGKNGQKGSTGSQGPTGALGKQGDQGPVGSRGDAGGPGSQGERGDAGKTGERGMTGAKGQTGRNGQQGPQGAPGPRGRRGDVGATGPAGLRGQEGDRGARGHQGITGSTGSNGAKGNTGETGKRGQQGSKGEAGAQGNTGATGPVGDTGNRGKVGGAGKAGENGSPGAAGEDGAPGDQGPVGRPGKPGPSGFSGSKGARGPVGKAGGRGDNGLPGPKGEPGPIGSSGLPGSQGQMGAGGPRGETGADGKTGAPGVNGPSGGPGEQGPIGERGLKGTAGRNGEPGNRGPNGIDGELGETGDPGNPGRQGDQGSPGAAGERGAVGPQGEIGPLGPTGPVGAPGLEGGPGKPGPSGETGDQGRRGARGARGGDGERGTDGQNGPPGETGEKGPKGEQGNAGQPGANGGRGPQGERGDAGPAGKDGYPGATGAVGPLGGRGSRGATGQKGVQGDQGVTGRQGETGPTGAPGAFGEKGGRGDYGPDGPIGAPGDTGPQGSPGLDGSAGSSGLQGSTGRQGPKGGSGDAGSPGSRGEPGKPGLPGRDGTPGESGDVGMAGGAGARGAAGPTGPGGMRGAVGAPGLSGADGIPGGKGERGSAGQNGKKGSAGGRGKVGEQGKKGNRGEVGIDGYPGLAGPKGYTGRDGAKGATGSRGVDGAQGPVGPVGVAGPQGQKGLAGPDGAEGAEGETGSMGQPGKVGERGVQGEIGDKGFTGDQGKKGDSGVAGPAGPPGATGRKGTAAFIGKTGAQGPKGPRGAVGEHGPAGGLGKRGPEGPAGGVGLAGPKGDRGPRGQDGRRGPPGPPGPPGRTAGHGITEIPSEGIARSSKNPNLYRSALGANEDVELNRESDVLTALVSLSNQVHFYKSPIGTKKFPARTCRDLRMCYGAALKNGEYWIDPNEGIPDDAVEVFCNFETNSTCIFPTNNATEKRKWFSGPDGYQWIGQDLKGLGQIRYVSDSTQLTFLRLLSDRAKQTITYHCKNSVAWYSEESQDFGHSIKLMGDNGIELHASSSNKFKPRIVRDDCRVKDGTWRRTVVEVDTHKTHRLPVSDVAVYDIGDKEEEFGLEIGPVCFS